MNFFLNKSSISIIDVIRKDLDFHAGIGNRANLIVQYHQP